MSNKRYTKGIQHSWTQSYTSSNYINNFTPPMSKQEIKTRQELARWEEVDRRVNYMDSYPQAEYMIKNIFKH